MQGMPPGGRAKASRKPLYMFVLSLLVGGVAVVYARQYIEEQIAFYRAQFEKSEPMSEVIVPARKLVRGEVLQREDLLIREIPTQYVDSNTIPMDRLDTAIGQVIDFDLDRGSALLWAHLEGGLSPTFSGKLAEGLRALTVRVDEINSISGFLQPTDRVDLMLTYGQGQSQSTFPLIEQIEVIATGTQTLVDKTQTQQRRQFTSITVEVTPHQAQQLTLAQAVGKLTAILRHPDDESPFLTSTMSVAELLGAPVVEAKPTRAPRPRVPARPSKPRIEYIIGGS